MKTFADAASSLPFSECVGKNKTKHSNSKPGKVADTSENTGQLELADQVRLEVQRLHSLCTLSWIVGFWVRT